MPETSSDTPTRASPGGARAVCRGAQGPEMAGPSGLSYYADENRRTGPGPVAGLARPFCFLSWNPPP